MGEAVPAGESDPAKRKPGFAFKGQEWDTASMVVGTVRQNEDLAGWVPESARWLLTQGRVEEAQKYLVRCAKLNGRPVTEDSLSQAINKVVTTEQLLQRPSYLSLFRTPHLRHISLCCMVLWFGVNFSYYGLILDVSGLGLNIYQTQLLLGVTELPSKIIVYFLVRHVGRRLTEAGMMLGAALTFGISLLVSSSETKAWITTLVVLGKGFSEAAFTTAYLFTSELYPTVLRQTGLGLTALIGRLGASLAPLAVLLDGIWLMLPKLVYGGIALLAACIVLLLPETKVSQLPETIQDVERKSFQEEDMQVWNSRQPSAGAGNRGQASL